MAESCVCVNVTLLLAFPFNSFSQEQAPAPSYKDGDFWVFRITRTDRPGATSTRRLDGDYEVSYAAGGLKAFQLTGSEKVEMTERISCLQGMVGLDVKDIEFQLLRFPLSVGQKWTREWRGRIPTGPYVLSGRKAEHRVVGDEQIATGAGSFRAFKVESELVTTTGGRGVFIYYYSPEAKSVVKFAETFVYPQGNLFGKTEVELIEFGTAP